jgi:hypothetical protein
MLQEMLQGKIPLRKERKKEREFVIGALRSHFRLSQGSLDPRQSRKSPRQRGGVQGWIRRDAKKAKTETRCHEFDSNAGKGNISGRKKRIDAGSGTDAGVGRGWEKPKKRHRGRGGREDAGQAPVSARSIFLRPLFSVFPMRRKGQ